MLLSIICKLFFRNSIYRFIYFFSNHHFDYFKYFVIISKISANVIVTNGCVADQSRYVKLHQFTHSVIASNIFIPKQYWNISGNLNIVQYISVSKEH